eukprot:5189863-Pleurochrysis_carterae.AAC.6
MYTGCLLFEAYAIYATPRSTANVNGDRAGRRGDVSVPEQQGGDQRSKAKAQLSRQSSVSRERGRNQGMADGLIRRRPRASSFVTVLTTSGPVTNMYDEFSTIIVKSVIAGE